MSRKPPAFPLSAASPDPNRPPDNRPPVPAFTVGSTCYLMSGSPKMTITHVYDDQTVDVAWCEYTTAEMYHAKLPIAALRREWK